MRDSNAGDRDETARGLGLAIAKRVCDMQGWSLPVESSREPGLRGTRFSLRFDAAIADSAGDVASAEQGRI
ncbi:hypothetical protein G6F63_016975 [Rhizopus arrhizus]|nr:hypothetical protein G6F63_016975 [Rhizopus arrhizus]